MAADSLQDRYQKLGQPVGDVTDTLSVSPIGTKGTPIAGPYPPGASGDQPPVEAARLAHVVIAGGTPRPAP